MWFTVGALAVGLMGVLVLAVVMIMIKKRKKAKKVDGKFFYLLLYQ